MSSDYSVSLVIPAYRSGAALWIGLAQISRWQHPECHRLQVLVIDDGSPLCPFREGSVTIHNAELTFLVNPENLGQSRTCLRGLEASDGDRVVFLEDDLRDWAPVLSTLMAGFSARVDLVNLDRGHDQRESSAFRKAVQPVVRRAFRAAGGADLRDPTSPLKALNRHTFPTSDFTTWKDSLTEGLILCSQKTVEVTLPGIRWDGRPSRYSGLRVAAMVARFTPRLFPFILQRRGRP